VLALEHARKSQPGGELNHPDESFNTTALQGNDSVIYEPDAARHTCYADARRRQQAAYKRIIADREFAPLISRAPAR